MARPTKMVIDLNALSHNFKRVKEFAPHQKILAMVKANAYGHGILQVTKELSMADAFGVASIDEGIALREANIRSPIVLMEGLFHQKEIFKAAEYQFSLVIHHHHHLKMLEKINFSHSFPVWLKINTGMNRLGIPLADVESVMQQLNKIKIVQKPIGLMTHFANADIIANDFTDIQLKRFEKAISPFRGSISMANSAAIMMHPNTHGDWVRPGLMLYGASPFKETTGLDFNLTPVMTLKSGIIAINEIKKGDFVGYGSAFVAQQAMKIAVVAIGYGDGYPQFANHGTSVLVNKTLCSLIGRVSMDMLTIDISDLAQVKIGEMVTLWGKGLPVEWIAQSCRTTPYEILTRMTPRPKIEIRKRLAQSKGSSHRLIPL